MCSSCESIPPNPGYAWCQGCFLAHVARSVGGSHARGCFGRGGYGGFGRGGFGVGFGRGGGALQPGAPPENASYEELMAWEAQRGGVGTGMSRRQLASLPERPFLGAGCDALKGDEATCVVCMSEYEEGETLSVLPGCAHTFHSQCVGRWLQEKPHCPVCMRDCRQDVQVA